MPADDAHFVFPGWARYTDKALYAVTVADFNADGIPDLAMAYENTQFLHILYGKPDGSLTEYVTYSLGTALSDVDMAAADLLSDPDNLPDLVVAGDRSGATPGSVMIILRNTGAPSYSFTVEETWPTGVHPKVTTGDFDGDGLLDIARAGFFPVSTSVQYAQPGGGFSAPHFLVMDGWNYARGLASADLDLDGCCDLVVIQDIDPYNHVIVAYGRPDRGFERQQTCPGIEYQEGLVLADFSGDGLIDIATGDNRNGCAYVYYAREEGGFAEPATFVTNVNAGYLAAGNIDGYGGADLVVVPERPIPVNQGVVCAILCSQGSKGFAPPVHFWAGSAPMCLAVANLDRTGPDEIIIQDRYRLVSLFRFPTRRPGASTLNTRIPLPDINPVGIAAEDFDGDRNVDLAVADAENNRVVLFRGLGNGHFERHPDELASNAPRQIVAAHLNNDAFLDLAVTSTGQLTIWYGAEGGIFPSAPEYLAAEGQAALLADDFNNDNQPDLALLGSSAITLLLSKDGRLDTANPIVRNLAGTPLYGATDMVAHHLDADNYLDLALCHPPSFDSNTVSILYGKGDGSFNEGQSYDVKRPARITAGDINGDNLIDIIIAQATWVDSQTTCITSLLGRPGGGFGEPQTVVGRPGVGYDETLSNILVSDFDHDNLADVILWPLSSQLICFGSETEGLLPETYARTDFGWITSVGAVADLDNDGRPDTVAATRAGDMIHESFKNSKYSFAIVSLNQSTAKIPGDLAVTDVTAPDTGVAGDVVTVGWTVQNQLSKPITAKWVDAIYLSRDTKWDIDDMRLAKPEGVHALAGNGEAGDSYTQSLEVALPGTATEDWYILVRTDASDHIAEETGEIDNVMASAIAMALPELIVCPVGDDPNDYPGLDDVFTLQRRALYYRLEAVEGEDLLVRLEAEPNDGANELYIRYGAVPSRSLYDAKYQTPFEPNQTGRIAGTQDGTYYVLIYAHKLPIDGNVLFNIRAEYLPFEITSITPTSGGNVGSLTVELCGTRLRETTMVRLITSGGDQFDAYPVYFENMSTIWPTFYLVNLPPGKYSVQIEDGPIRTLSDALTVVEGGGPEFEAKLIAPAVVSNREKPVVGISIEYSNQGNVDLDAPVFHLVTNGFVWLHDDPRSSSNEIHGIATSLMGPPGILRPGAMIEVLCSVTPSDVGNHINVRLHTHFPFPVYQDVLGSTAGANPEARFVTGVDGSILRASSGTDWWLNRLKNLLLSGATVGPLIQTVTDADIACNTLAAMMAMTRAKLTDQYNKYITTKSQEDYDRLQELENLLAALANGWSNAGCGDGRITTDWISSWDPNRKLRRAGFGSEGFVRWAYGIPYTIEFENLPAATAAALKVDVNDFLDPNLDWTTLELEEICFGETVIKVPEGLDHYQGRVRIDGWTWDEPNGWHRYDDVNTPVMPLVVDVNAGIDINTGLVYWRLECADPCTGYYPEDVYAGFLPPNVEEAFYPHPDDPCSLVHIGEGYVTFSVRPKPNLPTGAEIRNKASIVFDWNAAIDTNDVLNTIDANEPNSFVLPLPETTRTLGPVYVEWAGDDIGSGIAHYDIYVCDNGGDYTLWLNNTSDTNDVFTGENGHTYSFYSVATDNVGHREEPPHEPDAVTTVEVPRLNLDGDARIYFGDLMLFSEQWPRTDCQADNDWCSGADFDWNGKVNSVDFVVLADKWLDQQ